MLFFGLLLFIFLIVIRPQDFVPALTGLPLVFVLMGVLSVFWLLNPIPKKLFQTQLDKFMGLFFLSIILSSFATQWMSYILDTSIEILKLALIYFMIVTIIDSEKKFKIACWTLVVLMTVVAAMGILQFYGIDITGYGMLWASDRQAWQIRGAGNFDNPNDLAYSVALMLPFALMLALKSKILGKILGVTLLAIAIYCIFLTQSRGGLLAMTLSVAAFIYFITEGAKLKRFYLIVGGIGVITVFFIKTGGYRDDESAMGRVEAWVAGWDMLKSHPLFGVGKDQFLEYHSKDAHNSFVRAGAEIGIVGLYAWIGLLYFSYQSLLYTSFQKGMEKFKLYGIANLAFIFSFISASLLSSRTYNIIFMFIVALIVVQERLFHQISENHENTVLSQKIFPNTKIIIYTLSVLALWKLFLIQTW
ncbi:MAG: O-antigen ligase family protein [Gammaproteobacteria bacterium]|nr:O-antigen ligase family protein [Gammaproteobacteria bacterium]